LKLEQRPAQGDPRRDVGGMTLKTRLAGGDRVFELSGSTVLLRERRKSDGRRVQLDAAPQIFDSSIVCHAKSERDCGPPTAVYHSPLDRQGVMVTCPCVVFVRPASSVTVSVTT
jgi:hypothetical protein